MESNSKSDTMTEADFMRLAVIDAINETTDTDLIRLVYTLVMEQLSRP